ncbi:L-lactate dehydrogenase [Clostridium sp. C8-1-8]|uniref:L-lactate dehydrogenase n=1 Tax=Clostridium sp. C8-1-8 TaxID=2698831 RepID=UPI00136E31DE|nr:L-lactate dehydrogenase [Clostridium sp. C8-1-8]
MAIKPRKVAIVGTGLVGSSCAFSLVNQGVCEEVLMIDLNEEKALGEAMDLTHAVEYLPKRTKIYQGGYDQCGDADVVIITAGAPPKIGQSRIDTLDISAKICNSIVQPIMKSGFDGFFIIVSNPVDIITYHVWKISGLPRNKVMGTGTSVDSARLKTLISEYLDVDPRSVQGYAMGEHGDAQMIPWSHVYVGGKPFLKIMEQNPDTYGKLNLDEIEYRVSQEGWAVFNRKGGSTYYGISSAAVGIIKSILFDEHSIIPVSAILDGEYGEYNVASGVPAIINAEGVKDILEIEMTEKEKEKFKKANESLRGYIARLGH